MAGILVDEADFFKEDFEEVVHVRAGTDAVSEESGIGLTGWPFDTALPTLGSAHL